MFDNANLTALKVAARRFGLHAADRLITFKRLVISKDGAGAVEFAFLAPILLALYLSSFEVTVGINLSRKISKSAGAIADIVTQQDSVKKSFLSTMLDAAASNLAPYEPQGMTMRITGIKIDASSTPKVFWSWDQAGGRPYIVGSTVNDVPGDLISPDSFIVKTEINVPHTMLLFLSATVQSEARTLNIKKTYYYRQRLGTEIVCSDC